MSYPERSGFRFGPYCVDTTKRRLVMDGIPIPLTAKAFDTLMLLLREAGTIVSKDDLINHLWPDTAVEENNLIQQISALRKIFGERARDHRYIVTVSGRGYSFVAPVTELADDEGLEPAIRPARTSLFEPGTLIGASYAFSLMLLIGLLFVWSGVRNSGRPKSLAVLQFRSAVDDKSIGAGISDTLRARLGSVDDLNVRPIDGSLTEQDAMAAGRRLHLDTVLTGSIQRENEHVRVAVEMLDIAEGRIVWGKTFDDNVSNIFVLQDSIASEIARVLRVKFTAGQADLHERRGSGAIPAEQTENHRLTARLTARRPEVLTAA